MRLILVRHGETVENKLHILQGQMAGKLTEAGILQIKELSDFLTSYQIDICFTSDLQRAIDTVNIIVSKNPDMKLIKDSRLRERFLGELQGKPIPDNWNGMNYHESAESIEKLFDRVKSFISYIQLNYSEQTILIVSHGITIKVIMLLCFGYDKLQFEELEELSNCSVNILDKTLNDSQFFLSERYNFFNT